MPSSIKPLTFYYLYRSEHIFLYRQKVPFCQKVYQCHQPDFGYFDGGCNGG